MASQIAWILMPQISWLQSFTAWPAPGAPTWLMVVPMASKNGRARANASASPPAMMESVAFLAPIGPPETGASTMSMPAALRSAAMRRTATGEMVLMSAMRRPRGGFASRPASPWTTSSTCGVSGSMVMAISASRAASAGLDAASAPSAASSSIASRRTS